MNLPGVVRNYTRVPEFRAAALWKQSGFFRAVEHFDKKFAITDDEREQVVGEFFAGVDKYDPEEVGAGARFVQNVKDSFWGIEGVGSLSGVMIDSRNYPLQRLKREIEQGEKYVAQMKAGQSLRTRMNGGFGSAFVPAIPPTPERIEREERGVERRKQEYRKKGIEYLNVLAKRHGEYAGIPEWDNAFEGLVALAGQAVGAVPSLENLTPVPGGPVAGGVIRRLAVGAGRQAAENVAANVNGYLNGVAMPARSGRFWSRRGRLSGN